MSHRIESFGDNLKPSTENSVEMNPAAPAIPSPRPKAVAIALLVAAGLVYGVLRDEEGVMHVFKERSRVQELSRSVARLREENTRLRSDIRALREDPRAVERVAREQLGLSREGEIVFVLEGEGDERER